jgi:hypothetical protein
MAMKRLKVYEKINKPVYYPELCLSLVHVIRLSSVSGMMNIYFCMKRGHSPQHISS